MNEIRTYWSKAPRVSLSRRSALGRLTGSAAGAGLALLAACGKSAAPVSRSGPSGSSGAQAGPRSGGNVSVAQPVDPFDWDVTYLGKNTNNVEGLALAYDPAIRFKYGPSVQYTDLKIEPALADRWESPDDQTYTFHVRPGVKFANLPPVNGRALTAADIRWSWEYESRTGQFATAKLPAAQNAWMFSGIDSVQTPDPQTATVKFKQPYTPFLDYVAYTWSAIMPHEMYDQYGKLSDHIVGTGAFQLDTAASQKGTKWLWKKNPNYWDAGKPYLDQVTWLILADTPTQIAAFQTKQLDIMSNVNDPNIRAQIQRQRPDAHLDEYLTFAPIHLYIEVQKPPLNDLRVRQAVSLSLDRDVWVKTYAPGKGGWALAGAFPDTYSQEEMHGMLKTDYMQAKQLLNAAGFSNGPDLEILTPGTAYGDTYVHQAELLQSQLRQGGFNTSIKSVDKATYLARKKQHQYQLVFTGKAMAPDVDSYLTVFEPGAVENYGGIDDSTLSDLILKQRQEADAARRKQIVREAVKRINVDQVWALAIFYPEDSQLWNPNLQGYGPDFGFTGWPLAGAWLNA